MKKILVVAGIVLLLLIVTGAIIITVKYLNNGEHEDTNVVVPNIKVTGKLDEYIKNLTDNYYIKYSGKFSELVDAIIEYTKDGNNYGLRSSELDMHLICQGSKLYSVSSKYKLIVEMGRDSFKISEYNLASDIGQTFVKSYQENINSTIYDVQEYTYNGKNLKYYFKDSDIKLIRYDGQDIRIIRLENKTNTELLVKPEGYTYAIA